MTGADFESALRRLIAKAVPERENVACMACDQSSGCSECTFCNTSKTLARCHYCVACADCVDCTHCVRCSACLACQHCIDAERCIGSAYLVRCVACSSCTYCFGCVGLSKRDFHILNEPYTREAYFELTRRLARELGIAQG